MSKQTIFQKILSKWACKHKWETYAKVEIYDYYTEKIIGHNRTLICKECGKIKKIKL